MNLRRSVLFTPGDQPDMMEKALAGDSDVVVFDLEDAVAPERKQTARDAVRDVLQDVESGPEVWVRVNDVDVEDDFDVGDPSCFVLPKTASAVDVESAVALAGDSDVVPILETAAGVLAAREIASVDGVSAVVFGAEDLAADVGITRSRAGTEVLHARQHVVLAAAAADVDAVDTLVTEVEDVERLREDARRSAHWGYTGKLAVHPRQVDVIHEAFTPDEDEVEWARRVLAARDEAGGGVFEVDGEMIDAPLVRQAERVVRLAEAADV
ncbi:MAG: HpcH/HpaI aldolase/citrate lyase family protein [Halobacteriota archaeon]